MKRHGFTLVELLVVIAIIGILVAMMLPAVQSARESGRRVQCGNNIRQIALAVLSYEEANRELPYGSHWKGGAMIGSEPSWVALILSHLDQQALYDSFDFTAAMNAAKNVTAVTKPIATLICPSDPDGRNPILHCRCTCCGMDTPYNAMGLWYAGSMGPVNPGGTCPFCPSGAGYCCQGTSYGDSGGGPGLFHRYPISVTVADVKDGMSNTILCGETLPKQNIHMAAFSDNMALAATNFPINVMATNSEMPVDGMSDTTLHGINPVASMQGFKSLHVSGAQFVMGDGSVRFFNQAIDFELYCELGTRKGGEANSLP